MLWPDFDPTLAVEHMVTIAVQINGKLRITFQTSRGASEGAVRQLAEEAASYWLKDKEVVKIVVVPDKLINFVVK